MTSCKCENPAVIKLMPGGHDHVVITYTTVSGDDRQIDFIVDDYERRNASGAIDQSLDERALPKLRQTWHPVFTETARWVGHRAFIGGGEDVAGPCSVQGPP